MKSVHKKLIATATLMAVFSTVAEATPAFARQMKMDCMSCHFQNIPKLNEFGRSFKHSGFTMTSAPSLESKAAGGLSLPERLNMGFITKARLHKKDQKLLLTEVFDESAFVFGGRVSENIGTSMEFGAGLLGGKFIYSQEALGGRVGLAYFTTDALGAFSGLEAYSTGLYRPIRQFENRSKANIFQKLGIGDGAATGSQVYYSGNGIDVTVGAYMPVFATSAESGFTGYKMLARANYETTIASQNIAIGAYYIGGDVSSVVYANGSVQGTDTNALSRTSYGIDAQTQGSVANMTLMVTAGLVLANTYANSTKDETGYSVAAQLNPVDDIGVKAAFLSFSDNKDHTNDNSNITIGTEYDFDMNVRLCLEYTYTVKTTPEHDILFMSMIAF